METLMDTDFGSERLFEASVRLAEVTLHELDHRFRETQIFSFLFNFLRTQLILDHKLSEVADNFGRWSNLTRRIIKYIFLATFSNKIMINFCI